MHPCQSSIQRFSRDTRLSPVDMQRNKILTCIRSVLIGNTTRFEVTGKISNSERQSCFSSAQGTTSFPVVD